LLKLLLYVYVQEPDQFWNIFFRYRYSFICQGIPPRTDKTAKGRFQSSNQAAITSSCKINIISREFTIVLGSGYSTGSGLLEKNVKKTDCMFYHSALW